MDSMWHKLSRHLRKGDLLDVATRKVRKTLVRRRASVGSLGDTYYGEQAESYLERRRDQPSWQAEQAVMQDLLGRLPDGLSVLDVPFGTGRFVPYYHEKRMKVFGLDASADMIGAARRVLGEAFESCEIRTGDARALPYADDSFDVVVSFRFLQTMVGTAETPIVLRELHRVSRATSILELKVRKDHVPRPSRRPEEPMTFQLSDAEIRELLDDVGFVVRDMVVIAPPDSKYRELATKCAYLCEKRT